HRQLLTGILSAAGVPLEKHDQALVALDKLDKAGRESVQSELAERGIPLAAATELLEFFAALSSLDHAADIAGESAGDGTRALNTAILGRLVEFVGNNELGARGLDELRSLFSLANANGTAARIKIDPSLARGLSYYTGVIVEINVKDLPGSLGGGGRYDSLVGMFLGQNVPACGFSLGLERIIVVMTERQMFPPVVVTAPADVMITIWNEDAIGDSLSLATDLRSK